MVITFEPFAITLGDELGQGGANVLKIKPSDFSCRYGENCFECPYPECRWNDKTKPWRG